VVLTEEGWDHPQRAPFALAEIANEAGNKMAAGTVAAALIWGLMGLELPVLLGAVTDALSARRALIDVNLKAAELGYRRGVQWEPGQRFRFQPVNGRKTERLWISGGEAVALGAVAGGVAFMAAYPMSPSTPIITNLAQWADRTGVVTEQAEDEIAAINMVAGASWAGARAMTATSRGGFDLMSEGISLIGQIEVPAVVVIGQRPGPSTNQATRTQQSDLRLALHAGHGHFARVVFALTNIADGFAVTARALDIAERYQVPVFVLTDQQLQDAQSTVEPFATDDLPRDRHYLTADALNAVERYRRYARTPSGVSPPAAPGVSRHLVVCTSDEHDETGHITEIPHEVEATVEKRLRKVQTIAAELIAPLDVRGSLPGATLLISWGSSYEALVETCDRLAAAGHPVAHLHFTQLWPLSGERIAAILDQAKDWIVVENNLDGQLADLLQQVALRPMVRRVNKLDGRPFSVEELVERIGREIER
jgi:2-oxoglutarate ferredoxin oxidoreductase subunit alpha